MVIEPPCQLVGSAVLEIDDDVFISVEQLFVEKLLSTMKQTGQRELGIGIETPPEEFREHSGRTGAVEATVVIKETYSH